MSDALLEISTQSIQEQVLERLRDAILNGRYQPGEALRIDALASELGVSHMPVREALHLLTMEGLAVRQPRRGVVVSEIGEGDMEQAYRTLAALEAEAARAAALVISDAQVAELQAAVADPGHGGVLASRLAANRGLHDRIDAIAPNRWRDEFATRLRNFIYRMRRIHPPGPGRREAVAVEHAALVAALAARDAGAAARCAAAHADGARQDLLAQMRGAR